MIIDLLYKPIWSTSHPIVRDAAQCWLHARRAAVTASYPQTTLIDQDDAPFNLWLALAIPPGLEPSVHPAPLALRQDALQVAYTSW